jgi:hypothetical protein
VVICEHDVAIGYCWSGCAALQTLGRGHGRPLVWDSFSSAACVRMYVKWVVATVEGIVGLYLVAPSW